MPFPRIDAGDVPQDRGPIDFYPISKSTAQTGLYNLVNPVTMGRTCNEATFRYRQGTANLNQVLKCVPLNIIVVSLSVRHLFSNVTYGGETANAVSDAEVKAAIDQLWSNMIA